MAKSIDGIRATSRGLSALRADGFTDIEIERLVVVRERYQQGSYSEETQESKRGLFAKWLFEHGRITEELGDQSETVGDWTLEDKHGGERQE